MSLVFAPRYVTDATLHSSQHKRVGRCENSRKMRSRAGRRGMQQLSCSPGPTSAFCPKFSDPLGAAFNLFDFVERDEDGSQWVTTKKLGAYLVEWHAWEAKGSAEQRKQRFGEIMICLQLLLSTVTRLCRVDWAQHRSVLEQ